MTVGKEELWCDIAEDLPEEGDLSWVRWTCGPRAGREAVAFWQLHETAEGAGIRWYVVDKIVEEQGEASLKYRGIEDDQVPHQWAPERDVKPGVYA